MSDAVIPLLTGPVGAVRPVLYYSADGVLGPLAADAVESAPATRDLTERSTSQNNVNTGGCDLFDPEILVYRREREATPYGYYSNSGGECRGARETVDIDCYIEMWRKRDTYFIGNDNDDGDNYNECLAAVDSGSRYRKRTAHYSKAYVRIEIFSRGRWGYGRGPRGWDCSGQGTRTLECRRDSPVNY